MKLRAWLILILLGPLPLRAQDDLPKRALGEVPDFEPKLMLDGPGVVLPPSTPVASPSDRVQQCATSLLHAQQAAADGQELYKQGILAKVEWEGRLLRVIKARKELAAATLDLAEQQANAEKQSSAAHKSTPARLTAALAALKSAQDAAASASAAWDQAQVDAAAIDLARKRKLYSEGVGTRRELEMAEDKFALLSGTAAH